MAKTTLAFLEYVLVQGALLSAFGLASLEAKVEPWGAAELDGQMDGTNPGCCCLLFSHWG